MREYGLNKKEVLSKLKQARKDDLDYRGGRIFCSMCTHPHPSANMAHRLFLNSNLGDPGLFPGSSRLEKQAVAALGDLLGGKTSVGFIVSGGTEANLIALWAARNLKCIKYPEVVLPDSAHFSFAKVCNVLGLKAVQANLDKSFRVDPADVERHINDNTIAVIANAGSAELGAIDPINQLSRIAADQGIFLHVDAAFGGLVIPFLEELGYNAPEFDFRLKGVSSITVDPHKMGMSTIPAGGILFSNSSYLDLIATDTPYLTKGRQFTFLGTRPASSAAATWAVFESLGREGLKRVVKHCMERTAQMCSGLEEEGFELMHRPTMNIVGFRGANTKMLAAKLHQRGWYVSYVPRLDCIRVVLMIHSTRRSVEAFLQCLSELNATITQ